MDPEQEQHMLKNFDPTKPLPEAAEKECLEAAVRRLRTEHIVAEVKAAQNPPVCGKHHWLFAERCNKPLGHEGEHNYVAV